MKRAVLFLPGRYRRLDLQFYLNLCHRRTTVAVDGGYRFFRLAGTCPDVLIGDFDSLRSFPANLPEKTVVKRFDPAKNKTDIHLAVTYCLKKGATEVDIIQPSTGEIDHFLGNVLLMAHPSMRARGLNPKLRIVNPRYEIRFLWNDSTTFYDASGDRISVVILSTRAKLSCRGTEYPAENLGLGIGDSHPLRNRITAKRATFQVHGKALIVRHFAL